MAQCVDVKRSHKLRNLRVQYKTLTTPEVSRVVLQRPSTAELSDSDDILKRREFTAINRN